MLRWLFLSVFTIEAADRAAWRGVEDNRISVGNEEYTSVSSQFSTEKSKKNYVVINMTTIANGYEVSITLGRPPQPFKVWLGFGRNMFYLPSRTCMSEECHGRHAYNSSASETHEANGTYYTEENLSGFFTNDTICLQNICPTNTTTFLEYTTADFYELQKLDGRMLIGSFNAKYPELNILYNLFVDGWIQYPLAGFWHNKMENPGVKGEITLGGMETSRFNGYISWYPLDGNFGIKVGLVEVGDKKIGCKTGCRAYINQRLAYTGPMGEVEAIHKATGAYKTDQGFVFECDKISTLPEVIWYFGGKGYSISGEDYIQRDDDDFGSICRSLFVGVSDQEKGSWHLGYTFFVRYYTVIDFRKERFGIAMANYAN